MTTDHLVDKRRRIYPLVACWVALWTVFHVVFVGVLFSNALFWLNYYVPNYNFGFIRRGLAGAIVALFPDSYYFPGLYTVLWASTIVWLIALAVLMWQVVSTGARSERRIMLALAIPVLPCSLTYAVYSPHPELFGMAALLIFAVLLNRSRIPRARTILSAVYGLVIAILALVHEAIPLQLALGAALAAVVLPKDATVSSKRIYAVLAVGPGLLSTLLVAGLGHRDISAKLCSQIPHGMVDDPWAAATTPQSALDYMTGRIQSKTDFHDYICKNTIGILDYDTVSAVKLVGEYGAGRLIGSFIMGLLFFAGAMWFLRFVSGVPLREFRSEFRGNAVLVALAAALLIPIFMTGVDWTRWWILITANVAISYILYAKARPEIEQPPTRRTVVAFAMVVMVFAVLPLGSANNIGG